MLPHYSPFKVAETFSLLAGLYPGRIDLGIGRAPGTDGLTTYALQRDRRQAAPDDFPDQLAELLAYFERHAPAPSTRSRGSRRTCPAARSCRSRGCSGPRRRARSGPASSGCRMRSPTSSTRTAPTSPPPTAGGSPPITPARPIARPAPPSPSGRCAPRPTRRRATWLPQRRMTMRLLRQGRLIPVPPPEQAIAWLRAQGLRRHGAAAGRRTVVGSPERVRDGPARRPPRTTAPRS